MSTQSTLKILGELGARAKGRTEVAPQDTYDTDAPQLRPGNGKKKEQSQEMEHLLTQALTPSHTRSKLPQ